MSFVQWNDLSADLLRQARAVVIVALPRRMEASDADSARAELLERLREERRRPAHDAKCHANADGRTYLFNLLARHFGTRIPLEHIQSDPARTKSIGPWGGCDRYTFTDRVSEPVNDGVRGVCYQSAIDWLCSLRRAALCAGRALASGASQPGRTPAALSSPSAWRPSTENGGLPVSISDVPLAGVRDFGKGRVAYVGMAAYNIFARAIGNADGAKTTKPT